MTTLVGSTTKGGVRYDLSFQQGSTARAINFSCAIGEDPMSIELVEIAFKQYGSEKAFYSSDTGGITLNTNSFIWDEHYFDLPRGTYEYDLKVTHSGGKIDRLLHGIVKVTAKVTE